MVGAYTVRIGGTRVDGTAGPAAATYASATRVRIGWGISRFGDARFDLVGLNGGAEPTTGDRVQILYGGAVIWDGWIRHIDRNLNGVTRRITATDALGELDRRDVASRNNYTGGITAGTLATNILSLVGITPATSPIRTGTMNAGSTYSTEARVEYANSLKALRAVAAIDGQELTSEYDAASGTSKIHMRSRTGNHAASVATWRAGVDLVGEPILSRDDFEQVDDISVLGQGDGTSSRDTYGATTGAGAKQAVVPAKNLADSGAASAYAATLKRAFNDPRLVVIAPLRFFNLQVDQGIGLGDRVTIQDYAGTTIGDFRIIYVESSPHRVDGWFSRVVLIRATTTSGADYPALPVVTDDKGAITPGLADADSLLHDPQTYKQITDLKPTTLWDAISGNNFLDINLTGGTVVPAGGSATLRSYTGLPTDWGKADGYLLELFLTLSSAPQATIIPHAHAMSGHTHNAPGGGGVTSGPSPADTTGPITTGTASLQGPFVVRVLFKKSGSSDRRIWAWPLPPLRQGSEVAATGSYPFGYADDSQTNYTPDSIDIVMENHGDLNVTIDAASELLISRKPLFRLNG